MHQNVDRVDVNYDYWCVYVPHYFPIQWWEHIRYRVNRPKNHVLGTLDYKGSSHFTKATSFCGGKAYPIW